MRLARTIALRLILLIPVLIGVSLLVFAAVRILPGDPALSLVSQTATEADIEAKRQQLGLDRPVWEQYADYMGGLVQGDFGRSIHSGQVISEQLAMRVPATLELIVPAMLLAILLSLAIGIPVARRAGRPADHAARVGALAANAMPEFWLGMVLILVFYAWLGIAPAPSGRIAPGLGIPAVTGFMTIDTLLAGRFDAFLSALKYLALPVITLAIAITAPLLRNVRASAIEILHSDAYQCALAHGLSRGALFRGYLLKGTLARLPTLAALVFGALVGGSVLVEIVFSWQGMGQWAMRGMTQRDYPVIQGFVMLVAAVYVLVFLVADLLHAALDPRVRI